MEIKDIIRKRREELGLTYEELGEKVGVGKSTVRKWETGIIENIKRSNIAALAKALDISPALLMGWEENNEDEHIIKEENSLYTVAAHFEGEDFSEDDLDDIKNFIQYVKSKKDK